MSTMTDETDGGAARPPRDTASFFNDFASLYDRFTRGLDAPELPVNRWLEGRLGSGRRALDVGCGAGRYTILLAGRYDEVVGVDAAPAMQSGYAMNGPIASGQLIDAFGFFNGNVFVATALV